MKFKERFCVIVFALVGLILLFSSCSKDQEMIRDRIHDGDQAIQEEVSLTVEEEAMLIYMREEEKLAHDIYQEMFALYPLNIFEKIIVSETNHLDKVKVLLDCFELDDPASDLPGVFQNGELQDLYNELLSMGELSLKYALTVGATIEDLDIHDLDGFLAQTENDLIIEVFQYLECGSRNHLRSFASSLEKREVTYEPQYIDNELYLTIINSQHEFCSMAE